MSDSSRRADLSVLYGSGHATPEALGLPSPVRLFDGGAARLVGNPQLGRPQGGLALSLAPRHRLETGALCAAEVRSADRGMPSADVVCAGAFATVWLLRAACREARHWREAGGPSIGVSVPLARQGARLATMAQQVRTALGEAEQPRGMLELALGEADLSEPGLETPMFVSALRDLGAGVALDARAEGREYLQMMRRLPVTALRLHPDLVGEMAGSAAARSQALEAICMAHAMGAVTVALGVDTPEQHRILADLQCDEAQGAMFCEALPGQGRQGLLF